jgi:hypothetical protein
VMWQLVGTAVAVGATGYFSVAAAVEAAAAAAAVAVWGLGALRRLPADAPYVPLDEREGGEGAAEGGREGRGVERACSGGEDAEGVVLENELPVTVPQLWLIAACTHSK